MKKVPEFETAEVWEGRYHDKSTRWERDDINGALDEWLTSQQLQPGRILIPGCGRAAEPFYLAERGFEVVALDFAPSAIKHQQQRLHSYENPPSVRFEQVDVMNWRAAAPFDAIYEQTCLCALNPGQRQDYAAQLHGWLKPGGKLFALFMQTNREGGPPFHCPMDEMRQLFGPAKWQWPDHDGLRSDHSNNKVEIGMVLTRLTD
ncbi:MAG: thiopurine S-methyltransferase [Robiginitomaculum sp.]|nr:MAG: thiopurine S-methyltransferase [Robiginitomaculum sp.]